MSKPLSTPSPSAPSELRSSAKHSGFVSAGNAGSIRPSLAAGGIRPSFASDVAGSIPRAAFPACHSRLNALIPPRTLRRRGFRNAAGAARKRQTGMSALRMLPAFPASKRQDSSPPAASPPCPQLPHAPRPRGSVAPRLRGSVARGSRLAARGSRLAAKRG
jgi:hypothetical protein